MGVLALNRKLGERIIVGTSDGPLIIELLDVACGRATIGVLAPRKLPVHREEIWIQFQPDDKLPERSYRRREATQ